MNQFRPDTDVSGTRDAAPFTSVEPQFDRSFHHKSAFSGSAKSIWDKMRGLREKGRRSDNDAPESSTSGDQVLSSGAKTKTTNSRISRLPFRSIVGSNDSGQRTLGNPQVTASQHPTEDDSVESTGSRSYSGRLELSDQIQRYPRRKIDASNVPERNQVLLDAAPVETSKQFEPFPGVEKAHSKSPYRKGNTLPYDEQLSKGVVQQLRREASGEPQRIDEASSEHLPTNGMQIRRSLIPKSVSAINLRSSKPLSNSPSQLITTPRTNGTNELLRSSSTYFSTKSAILSPQTRLGDSQTLTQPLSTPLSYSQQEEPARDRLELTSRSSTAADRNFKPIQPGSSRIPTPLRYEPHTLATNEHPAQSSNLSLLASPSALQSLSSNGHESASIPASKLGYKHDTSQGALNAVALGSEDIVDPLELYKSQSTPNLLERGLFPVTETASPFPDDQTRLSAHRQILSGYFAPRPITADSGSEDEVSGCHSERTEPAFSGSLLGPVSPIDELPPTIEHLLENDLSLPNPPAHVPTNESGSYAAIKPLSESVSTASCVSPRKISRALDIRSIRERTPSIPISDRGVPARNTKLEPKSSGGVHLASRIMSATGNKELLEILAEGPPQDDSDIIGIPYDSTIASDAPTLDSDSERPPLRTKRSFTDLVKLKLSGSKENLAEYTSSPSRSRAASQSSKRERSTSRERSISQPILISEVGENVQCEARAALDADFTKFVSTLPADHEEEIQRHMRTPPSSQALRIVTVNHKDLKGKGKEVHHVDPETPTSNLNQRLHVRTPGERRAMGKEKEVERHDFGVSVVSPNDNLGLVGIEGSDIKGKGKEVVDVEQVDAPKFLRKITNTETDIKGQGKEVESNEPRTVIDSKPTDTTVPMTYLTLKPKVQNKICWICDKSVDDVPECEGKLMRCDECKSAFYCSSACRQVHKKECVQHQAILAAADRSAAHVLCTRKTVYPDGYFTELLKRWHVMEACIQQTVGERKLNSFVNSILTELAWTQAMLHGDLQSEDWALFMESAFRALFKIPRLAVGRGVESQHPNHNMHRKSVFLACVRCFGTCDGCGRKCCVMNSLQTEHRHAKLFGPDFQAIGEIMATIDAWYRLYTIDPATFVECLDCKETGKQYQYCPWCFNMCAFESETAETSYEVRCIKHHDEYLDACSSLSDDEHAQNAAKMRESESVHPSERSGGYLDDNGEVREE